MKFNNIDRKFKTGTIFRNFEIRFFLWRRSFNWGSCKTKRSQ